MSHRRNSLAEAVQEVQLMSLIESRLTDDPDFSGKAATTRLFFLRLLQLHDLLMLEVQKNMAAMSINVSRSRVIGVLTRSSEPLTVPEVADRLGLSRQGVSKLVQLMVKDGLLAQVDNPSHKLAKRVIITPAATAAYRATKTYEADLITRLSEQIDEKEIEVAMTAMERLIPHLLPGETGSAGVP